VRVLEEPATFAAPKVTLLIVILQFLLIVKMLVARLAIIVSRALDPVLLPGMPGIEVDITVVAVIGHGAKMDEMA
jgi:hypothetical protein